MGKGSRKAPTPNRYSNFSISRDPGLCGNANTCGGRASLGWNLGTTRWGPCPPPIQGTWQREAKANKNRTKGEGGGTLRRSDKTVRRASHLGPSRQRRLGSHRCIGRCCFFNAPPQVPGDQDGDHRTDTCGRAGDGRADQMAGPPAPGQPPTAVPRSQAVLFLDVTSGGPGCVSAFWPK